MIYINKNSKHYSDWQNLPSCQSECLTRSKSFQELCYRGSYIDASCQVWFNLAKQFQRRFFFTLANQKKELLLAAIFVGKQNETKKLYRDLTQMFPAMFGSIWLSSFRGEDFLNSRVFEIRRTHWTENHEVCQQRRSPCPPNIFEWCVYFFNGSRKRRLYCKYRNKFGQN